MLFSKISTRNAPIPADFSLTNFQDSSDTPKESILRLWSSWESLQLIVPHDHIELSNHRLLHFHVEKSVYKYSTC